MIDKAFCLLQQYADAESQVDLLSIVLIRNQYNND
jgi:hypothetical protein